jgi:hypothetical protein
MAAEIKPGDRFTWVRINGGPIRGTVNGPSPYLSNGYRVSLDDGTMCDLFHLQIERINALDLLAESLVSR